MTKKEEIEKEKNDAIKELKELFKKGKYTVYTVLRHVSRSGMMRRISCFVMVNNQPINIDWYIEKLGTYQRHKNKEGLLISGCGMDMGFSLVYNTSAVVYRGGFICRGEKCPSNDHPNGDRNYKPHKHSDGGYNLKQRWI